MAATDSRRTVGVDPPPDSGPGIGSRAVHERRSRASPRRAGRGPPFRAWVSAEFGPFPRATDGVHHLGVRELPSGTVTLLFTDVEGSTHLLHELGPEAYALALAEHRRVMRDAFGRMGGIEVDTQGDAFFVVFTSARQGVAAAAAARQALANGAIRARMGLHTGTPHLTSEGYVGSDVHLAARIAAAGHGGQILLSAATRAGISPDPELTPDLTPDPAADRTNAPHPDDALDLTDLVDLGEHRLKDFERPVAIFQLGSRPFPPLRTISNTNLPRPASSFVGRATDVAAIVDHLRDGTRFLTLTGPGGSGKTRLAIEAASELVSAFRAGVFWVGVAPLRDAGLVVPTIARTIGAPGELAAHIAEREFLLVIDNLEQVVAAAPELAALVEACPNLRLLATSRERLRVRGEVELPVLPLEDGDAVRLFAERSGHDPADADVLALVRALDNLPLAVELAAARASVLSPGQIRARLSSRLDLLRGGRDADPRQHTLRATIAWSFELLAPDEQQLFARLAIFRGGWTLEAAMAVARADIDALEGLVDKSLVRHRDDRFWMLETIREFASERLDASGERDEVAVRHAHRFVDLAEEAVPHLRGSPKPWLDGLELEHDNIRAALDWLEASGESQEALQLAGALGRFWAMRGHFAEGRARLERILSADDRPTVHRARALNSLALIELTGAAAPAVGERVRDLADRAASIFELLDDPWGKAQSRFYTGSSLIEDGRADEARRLLEEAGAAFDALGDDHYALLAARQLAWAHFELGDRAGARARHEEVVRRATALGNLRMKATSLGALGEYDLHDGRVDDAEARLRESTKLWLENGELLEVVANLQRFAWLSALRGSFGTAVSLLAKAGAMEQDIGGVVSWMRRETAETEARIRAVLAPAAWDEAWAAGTTMTLDQALELAMPPIAGA